MTTDVTPAHHTHLHPSAVPHADQGASGVTLCKMEDTVGPPCTLALGPGGTEERVQVWSLTEQGP